MSSVAGLVAASLLASLAAACGGGDSAASALADAASTTQEVDTMRMAMTTTTTVDGGTFTIEGSGAADNSARLASMRATLPSTAGGEMEIVMDGTTIYMRMPQFAPVLPPGKSWAKFDLQRLGEGIGVDLESLIALGEQAAPTQSLDYLRAAGSVERAGTEQVRGVETTRYSAELDFEAYADAVEDESPRTAKTLRAVVEEYGGELVVPMEVWVDEDGLVRRQSVDQPIPGVAGSSKQTIEFYDFGADVDIRIPDPKAVTSGEELYEKTGG